jgi:hypothetical protein
MALRTGICVTSGAWCGTLPRNSAPRFTRLATWPKWHSSASERDTSGLFRQRQPSANVQWLASPQVVLELGGRNQPTPTLELGPFGDAKPRAALWGRGCSDERPRNSGQKSLGRFVASASRRSNL